MALRHPRHTTATPGITVARTTPRIHSEDYPGMTMRVCSAPRCPQLHTGAGRCPTCRAEADRKRRPNGNPYTSRGHRRFREQVLARDPVCVTCLSARSTVADHAPLERWQLEEQGLDANDPQFGQGLCKNCHDKKTAKSYGFGGAH